LEALYYLCKRNGIKVINETIDYTLYEQLVKFEASDDYSIVFDKIALIDYTEYKRLCNRYEGGCITLYEKYQVEKFKFIRDNDYNVSDINDETKEMWKHRSYIHKFDELLKDTHIINSFLESNGIHLLSKKEFVSFPINGYIPRCINIKDDTAFIDKFNKRDIVSNYGQNSYIKLINDFFGGFVLNKRFDENGFIKMKSINGKQYVAYETSDNFIQTLASYKKYNRNYQARNSVYEVYAFDESFI